MRILLIGAIFLVVFQYSYCQMSNLHFNELGYSDGLYEITNMGFYQDSNGFIWVNSFDGLTRFDGTTVKVFRPTDASGQSDPTITGGVFEDAMGEYWFSTPGGVHVINQKEKLYNSYTFHHPTNGKIASDHYAFHLDQKSNLWVVADDYLILKNTITRKDSVLHTLSADFCYPIENEEGEVIKLVYPLLEKPFGIEVVSYDQDQITRKEYFIADDPGGFPEALIFFVHVENDSIIWLPSHRGLIRFNTEAPSAYKLFKHNEGPDLPRYCDVQAWGNQYLWIASTREGIFLFDKRKESFIRQDTVAWVGGRKEPLKRVNKIYVDNRENLWLAIWGKKILYTGLSKGNFSSLLGSNENSVSSMIEDHEGRLWLTVPEKGILISDSIRQNFTLTNPFDKFSKPGPGQKPSFLYCDQEGNIWILSYNTLVLWEKTTATFRLVSNSLQELQRIIQIANDRYLLMTYDNIFEIKKPSKDNEWPEPETIGDFQSILYNYYLTQDNHLLVSTVSDLYIFSIKEKSFEQIIRKEKIGYINGVGEDQLYYWLASNKGLVRIRKSDLFHEFIRGENQLLSRSFKGLLVDDKGDIWLSSNNGLFHYNPNTEAVQHFTQSDGLRNTQFNLASQFKDADGKLYFGGTNGITYFDPDKVKLNQNPPIIQLTEVLVNSSDTLKGYDLSKVEELSFPYAENTLSFNFVSIEYSAPHENQHAYFLEGYDRDTVYTETRGFAHYPNLPYGRYTLRLMGSNSDGVWTSNPRELEIVIRRPWYHTWWFRIASFFLAFILASSLYKRHIDQVREREITKRKEAELKQRVTAHQMALLRLQMNPHFFSNSLSAIGHYVLDEAPRTAYGFLQHFSTLMRGVLEKATQPYISLEEEIELLTSFLEIKSLELPEEQLSWDIEVDTTLDQDEVLVPTMLVQPIVENAIEHGIAPKKGKGSVHLSFKRDKEKLVGTIQDDGIGRAAAAQLENAKKGNTESKAMSITLDRLRLLQQETGLAASMEVIDLVDENGTALGTKVVLILPLTT